MEDLSLEDVYTFTQQHKRTNAKSMKNIIEYISKKAMMSQKYELDSTVLTLFSNAFLALDIGSPPQFILNTLLLKLLARKRKI
jgi:DNA polymerase-3 subunit delta'